MSTYQDRAKLTLGNLMLATKGIVNKYNNPTVSPKEMNDELDDAFHQALSELASIVEEELLPDEVHFAHLCDKDNVDCAGFKARQKLKQWQRDQLSNRSNDNG